MSVTEWLRQSGPWRVAAVVAVIVITVAVIAVATTRSSEPAAGYRLRAETMVPTELSVRHDQVDCPAGRGRSPVDYLDAGSLAKTLPVYDGDLIAVRILTIPTGRDVDEVRFGASWPSTVIGDGQPVCVFVVDDDGSSLATVDWADDPDGGTEIVLSDVVPGVPTEIEIWLTADDPPEDATFRTEISPGIATDEVVLDPLGGRVNIDRRPSAVPTIELSAEPADPAAGRFDVTATVSNPNPTTRALDVGLRLEAPNNPTWTVVEESSTVVGCREAPQLDCSLGELGEDDAATVVASVQLGAGWAPTPVTCEGPPDDSGFGICIEATVSSELETVRRASALVPLPRPADDVLTISTDPAEIIARSDQPVEFAFALSNDGPLDLGSVAIVGSDCTEIVRESQELEDDDAFLEVGETWVYPCELDVSETTTFRLDAAAVDSNGVAVTASYEGVVQLITPELAVSVVDDTELPTIEVRNAGSGAIRDVAVQLPLCATVTAEGNPARLGENEAVRYVCEQVGGSLGSAIAYGTDELGESVVGALG